jgi:hypothetical protein
MRRRFEPALAVVAESPPVFGKYVYDPVGQVTEPLFLALIRRMGEAPTTKEVGHVACIGHEMIGAT